jgi:ribosomal protein S18 acetylase RimI-like enzyme
MAKVEQQHFITVEAPAKLQMPIRPKGASNSLMRLQQFMYMVRHGGLRKTVGEMVYFWRKTLLLQARPETHQGREDWNQEDSESSFYEVSMANIENLPFSFPDNSAWQKSLMYAGNQYKGVFAARKNEIVGFNWYVCHENGESGLLQPDLKWLRLELKPGEAYLFDLWVRPDLRGRKIGLLLAKETLRILWEKGITAAYVFVFSDNTPSRKNLQKINYREIRAFRSHRFLWFKWSSGIENPPAIL